MSFEDLREISDEGLLLLAKAAEQRGRHGDMV
jgi:hypothetical protein